MGLTDSVRPRPVRSEPRAYLPAKFEALGSHYEADRDGRVYRIVKGARRRVKNPEELAAIAAAAVFR